MKHKNVIKMNLDLMVFIQEIIYLKKDRAYLLNLHAYESGGTHWITLYLNTKKITYFDSFEV